MTYCVGLLVEEGVVMIADTRTNAGIDNISSFRKLRVFEKDGKYSIAMASAGSLSTTQSLVNRLKEGVVMASGGTAEFVETAPSMFRVAQIVGEALQQAKREIDNTVQQEDVGTGVTLLLGGSIGGETPRLFLIYDEGNFIECGMDTPYLQIGELKYGKPILDRLMNYRTPIRKAIKLGLLSMSSTMRSNLSVGLPIDMYVLKTGQIKAAVSRIEDGDPYYYELGRKWTQALGAALEQIPEPEYPIEAV